MSAHSRTLYFLLALVGSLALADHIDTVVVQQDTLGYIPTNPRYNYTYPLVGQTLLGAEEEAYFGQAVASNADGTVVATGAVGISSFAGAVFVWKRVGDGWVQMGQTLYGPGPPANLGKHLALSDSGFRMIAGAPGASNGRGAVRVYEYDGYK